MAATLEGRLAGCTYLLLEGGRHGLMDTAMVALLFDVLVLPVLHVPPVLTVLTVVVLPVLPALLMYCLCADALPAAAVC
jgi:hypothetical protein